MLKADERPEHQAAVAAHVAPKEGGNRAQQWGVEWDSPQKLNLDGDLSCQIWIRFFLQFLLGIIFPVAKEQWNFIIDWSTITVHI